MKHLVLLMVLIFPASAAALVTQVGTRAEWASIVGNFATEDFDAIGRLTADASGVIHTPLFDVRIDTSLSDHGPAGQIGGSKYLGDVHGDFHSDHHENRFVFHEPTKAVAWDFSFVERYEGGLFVDVAGTSLFFEDIDVRPAFFGIVSDMPFNELAFRAATPWGRVGHEIDNVNLGISATTVPEPSTFALLLIGVTAIGMSMRQTDLDR